MKFIPKKEEELKAFNVFPAGEYDFDIVKASDVLSKAGNEMIVVELAVFDVTRKKCTVYDYLLENIPHKLKHICEAVGLSNEYLTGCLTADMLFKRSGRCVLKIEYDKSGKYSDKNVVKDYCKGDQKILKDNFNLDDIPF